MVVLPGGQPGTDNLKADARILGLLKHMSQQGRFVAAICAAPSVLAAAGLLDGRKATCYPTCLDGFPEISLQTAAVVEDGKLITSRSPGTAMDFALALVERLAGRAKRMEVEAGLER
jgi:protein deglycase